MAYSGNIVEYLGCDLAANRPVSLNLTPGALGIFHAYDTDELWLWADGGWISRGSGGSGIPDAPSDGTSYVRKDANWVPESAGGIPDAPSDGKLYGRKDADWEEVPAGGSETLQVITEAAAFTATAAAHAGLSRYIRAGGDVTFDSGEGYPVGSVFNVRATAALDLVGAGMTLEPTHGGTLSLEAGMSVTVVITGATTADVIGLTVAA